MKVDRPLRAWNLGAAPASRGRCASQLEGRSPRRCVQGDRSEKLRNR